MTMAISVGSAAEDLPTTSWAGCTAAELAALWDVPAVFLYERVGSTNDIARQLAVGDAPARSLVIADQQTRGRGRAGRSWSSPSGLGLYISQVIRPADSEFSTLPLRLGVLLANRLDRWTGGRPVAVKWPNDLLVQSRKLAGILCEAAWSGPSIDHIVIGIGINVLHRREDFPDAVRDTAVSLAELSAEPVSRFEVATAAIEALGALEAGGNWLADIGRRNALADCIVEIADSESGRVTGRGRVTGFDPEGGLVLAEGASSTVVRSGTVRIVQTP